MNEDILKLKTDCDIYKSKFDRLEQVVEKQEERIQELERNNTRTDVQYTQIIEKLDELSKEVKEIKEKPAKRYDTIIVAVITCIVSCLVTFGLTKLLS